jgi:hypothetical protein
MDVPDSPFDDEQQQQQQQQSLPKSHLEWSDRQRRILTADGRATELYCASRGYPFEESELPHHHLGRGATRPVFGAWKKQKLGADADTGADADADSETVIVGAWFRALFVGESDFTSRRDEDVCNVQTRTLFVDLRIPKSRRHVFGDRYRQILSLADLKDGDELRWHARQHVFAGHSVLVTSDARPGMAGCCVRHHCLDWNYVGVKRPVPNKWWIERNAERYPHLWKEWSYATNDVGHPYYGEVWERLSSSSSFGHGDDVVRLSSTPNNGSDSSTQQAVIALRKRGATGRGGPTSRQDGTDDNDDDDDGVLVIVGDHFNFCVGRPLAGLQNERGVDYACCTSLVDLVDRAVAQGDFGTARAWLGRIGGGHGRISRGWKIDLATEFWREGTPFWNPDQKLVVAGDSMDDCTVRHGRDEWDVFECNMPSAAELKSFLIPASGSIEASDRTQSAATKRQRLLG